MEIIIVELFVNCEFNVVTTSLILFVERYLNCKCFFYNIFLQKVEIISRNLRDVENIWFSLISSEHAH